LPFKQAGGVETDAEMFGRDRLPDSEAYIDARDDFLESIFEKLSSEDLHRMDPLHIRLLINLAMGDDDLHHLLDDLDDLDTRRGPSTPRGPAFLNINVKGSKTRPFPVRLRPTEKFLNVKEEIVDETGVKGVGNIGLSWKNRAPRDDQSLEDAGVKTGDTIMYRIIDGGQRKPAAKKRAGLKR
jgi:hypothetical protein